MQSSSGSNWKRPGINWRSLTLIDRIGAALQRALDCASRDDGFDDRRGALAQPLRRICAWLGGPWHRLLGFIGLTF